MSAPSAPLTWAKVRAGQYVAAGGGGSVYEISIGYHRPQRWRWEAVYVTGDARDGSATWTSVGKAPTLGGAKAKAEAHAKARAKAATP